MTVPVNLCALSHPFTPFLDGSNTKHLFFPFPLHTTRSDHLTPFQATECKWKDVVVLLASLAAPLVKRVLPSGQPCPLLAPRLGRKAANAADTLRPRRKCGGDQSLWPRALASVHCRKHATGCPTPSVFVLGCGGGWMFLIVSHSQMSRLCSFGPRNTQNQLKYVEYALCHNLAQIIHRHHQAR